MNEKVQVAYKVLQDYLIENFDAKYASGKKEVIKRCHYCGDSKHSTNSRHLYIGINKYGLISYHCFLCGSGDVVDAKFFRDLGIYDTDLINLVLDANFSQSGSYYIDNVIKQNKKTAIMVNNPMNLNSYRSNYINERLGLQFSMQDLYDLKVVDNLLEFLNYNGIYEYSRNINIMKQLSEYFIGFLSIDNSHIIMRRLVEKNKVHENISSRYVNYNLTPNNNEAVKYYVIPTTIDISKPITIHMAEGIFDILSICFNLYGNQMQNSIYIATCGKVSYISALNYLIFNKGIPLLNSTIHIYLDNDISEYELRNLANNLRMYNIPFYFHRNKYENEKDYGVPKERIVDTIFQY